MPRHRQVSRACETYCDITFMKCAGHKEDNIVNHVAIGAVVQECAQRLISLQSHEIALLHGARFACISLAKTTAASVCLLLHQCCELLTLALHTARWAYICTHAIPVINKLLSTPLYNGSCM